MDRRRARAELEQQLGPRREQPTPTPAQGWVRTIRDALGMTTRDLGRRAGLSHVRITQIEQGEAHGTVTLETLEHAAAALGCRLEYAFVPLRPLDDMVRAQARAHATAALQRDRRPIDEPHWQRELDRLTEQRLDRRGLWADPDGAC